MVFYTHRKGLGPGATGAEADGRSYARSARARKNPGVGVAHQGPKAKAGSPGTEKLR